ncbi:type IV toxin-antitoxin system YeeU family antitoxin [Aeromonas jandaei]|uniref:type IV toxin-antitoxin system YeeU family antitoxin n=1 Tax=Aeromonas jandaei TaxID=650 RepID=UPI0030DD3B26
MKNITIKVPGKHPQTGELDAQRQQCITIPHGGFTCKAATLSSHGYLYICIYAATSMDANPDRKCDHKSACGHIWS